MDRLFIRAMSALVKKHILCIQTLARVKNNNIKKAIIANADAKLLCALAECAYNILTKNIPLTALQRRRLGKYRTKLRELARKKHDSGQEKTPLVTSDRRGTERRFPIGFPSSVGWFGLAALASSGVGWELDAWITRERWLW